MRLLVSVALVGCSTSQPEVVETEAFAGVVSLDANVTRIAVTGISTQMRIPDVLLGLKPRDFHWIMFSLENARLEEARSSQGLLVNLASASNAFTFEQVYLGVCNPAKDDFGKCFLYEALTSGGPGVSGNLRLRLSSDRIDAEYDVVIEGITDRFGEPLQWHKHGSIGVVSATYGAQGQQ